MKTDLSPFVFSGVILFALLNGTLPFGNDLTACGANQQMRTQCIAFTRDVPQCEWLLWTRVTSQLSLVCGVKRVAVTSRNRHFIGSIFLSEMRDFIWNSVLVTIIIIIRIIMFLNIAPLSK